ncbi:MAG: peptidase M14 [Ignavibacteriae bacterium]|nr:MAG: peptidase M14 [Ignavibacteriota bacterium]
MKYLLILLLTLLTITDQFVSQNLNSLKLYNSYSDYREKNFNNKLFKYSSVKNLVEELKKNKLFTITKEGTSLDKRDIYLIKTGKGRTNVLLWSQMHGDEPTATMALFDFLNFMRANDEFNYLRKFLLEELTIYIIPMLNPDGASKIERRNALGIDLNRDALRLQFPESKILKNVRDRIEPKFGFNLHDQSTRYTVGNNFSSATISFLAPAFNFQKDINEVRANTMKVIANIYEELSKFIPGHIAKYNDDFEPRAFGDNFVKWGTSSILIESGGWKNDHDKQFIRKLNFISILTGLYSISTKKYEDADIEIYHNIPFNDKLLFDVLLKNLNVEYSGNVFTIDIGINREENFTIDKTQNYYQGKIEDWGDLSTFFGYEELDLSGCKIKKSKILDVTLGNLNELDLNALIKEGFGFIKVDSLTINREYSGMPFNIILHNHEIDLTPKYNGFANFTVWKDNKLKYNIINGFIYDVNSDINRTNNGLIF